MKYFWRVDRNGKRDIIKKSINHQSCYFQRTNQQKGTKKCTRSQIFAEQQIQYFFNYHVFYFILYYIILSFFCLFIYLFYLKLTPEKKSPLPLPDRGFSFCRLFRELRPPGGLASIFHCIDYGGSENSPRSHC